ncbi:hypothetical protein PHYBLDRAFT_142718 [Phycomyces blakesleeanus NRRL 1555(-)]|uniref:K Homology domain-containing protein n=1 Tax=Phycomyces blakesleeanus (strain ATCC 8743b / DSM 1359 / FGSC 10004 / NBRC 33097 / NRRL 1555) TaxID=763407 RepID=A0A167P453_PHYB8|nr:hypothetical protein PHYBLDRAFT_142718 [Phycomyces blakesleeanus NRRL 1555(-)]OAD77214.1 hypothetical protein PHYBLDRAFT_142718 [Phycomyces blakesleeanus NRRL 1555(-)]|eukprot:XP_018295254.1 hypothetical protein PHYBLDRAFT_142718 [Phycomyces blakesleeanus NRRL 1555(-)]
MPNIAYATCIAAPYGKGHTVSLARLAHLQSEFTNQHTQLEVIHFQPSKLSLSKSKPQAIQATLAGSISPTMKARGAFLRQNPIQVKLSVKSFSSSILRNHASLTELLVGLQKISDENKPTKVVCTGTEITIFGTIDSAEAIRVKVLVFLDVMSRLISDTLEIPHHLHNLMAGRKHSHLQPIMEETATNIYLQSPFTSQIHSNTSSHLSDTSGLINITGESTVSIQRAKELLTRLAAQKVKSLFKKESTMSSSKIDWILLRQREEIRNIMRDNGSFIRFPLLGSGDNKIVVYAENRVNVERTYRLLNYLIFSIYRAVFSFSPEEESESVIRSPDTIMKQVFGSYEKMLQTVGCLAETSSSEVIYNLEDCQFEILGTEREVRNAYQFLCGIPTFKRHHKHTIFSLELASDHQDFISGKKNGKINKIMKSCAVQVKFHTVGQYTFMVSIDSNSPNKAIDGLSMLQEELPAEISFYVPEMYHRRIIGVGGKNIQRMMKTYGVYVKFSGSEEFSSLGGYFENEDNVVARTPMKNAPNLENLRRAVMEYVGLEKDRDFIPQRLLLPIYLHRTILHKYGKTLRDAARPSNTKIWWPERQGSGEVTVFGPVTETNEILRMLKRHIPEEKTSLGPVKMVKEEPEIDATIDFKNGLQKTQSVPKAGLFEYSRLYRPTLDLPRNEPVTNQPLESPLSESPLYALYKGDIRSIFPSPDISQSLSKVMSTMPPTLGTRPLATLSAPIPSGNNIWIPPKADYCSMFGISTESLHGPSYHDSMSEYIQEERFPIFSPLEDIQKNTTMFNEQRPMSNSFIVRPRQHSVADDASLGWGPFNYQHSWPNIDFSRECFDGMVSYRQPPTTQDAFEMAPNIPRRASLSTRTPSI